MATLLSLVGLVGSETAQAANTMAAPAPLATLFSEWRVFAQPAISAGVPDYTAAAMIRKAGALPSWQARLSALARSGWTVEALDDYRLIEAEMNGFHFQLRVLRPSACRYLCKLRGRFRSRAALRS